MPSFSSNDYLGLAHHPRVVDAMTQSLRVHGHGAGSARLLDGTKEAHLALESELASFKNAQSALLFSSGYHANLGVITALAGAEDMIFSDELNHASIIDGIRLARSNLRVYRHCDTAHLAQLMQEGARYRRRLIISETLFGMDGDRAPLAELAKIAERHDAIFIVDEAHATGIWGPHGAGLAAECNLNPDVSVATLGKAFGAFGAFVTGSKLLIDYLIQRARTFIFTTALPPAVAAGAGAALTIICSDEGDALRRRLRANAERLGEGLGGLGFSVPSAATIFPVIVGDAKRTLAAATQLQALGVHVMAIRPPTVPNGTSRLRLAPTALHTFADIDATLEAIRHVLR